MDKLLAYLNSLSTAAQVDFSSRCKTSVGYLRKACSKGSKLGAELCVSIESESFGEVSRIDLRPFDWMLTWPELRAAHLPTTPAAKEAA